MKIISEIQRIVVIFLLVLAISMLSGCTSKEAKEVINEIDSLGEITLNSLDELQAVNALYNKLEEKDKEDVSNYDILQAANLRYQELLYLDFNDRIGRACEDITYSKYDELNALLDEYNRLDSNGKSYITNYDLLCSSIAESRSLLAKEAVKHIEDLSKDTTDIAKESLNYYAEILTDDQIKQCLLSIGRYESMSRASDFIRIRLIQPNSYRMTSGSVRWPELQEDGSYRVKWDIHYFAANRLGLTIQNDASVYVWFTIDTESLQIKYKKTEYSSAYEKWRNS